MNERIDHEPANSASESLVNGLDGRDITPAGTRTKLLGVDELNLAEFPLAACGHRLHPEQKTLVFEDQIFDEGNRQPVKRKLIISASDAWGLPTPVDSDVLLVLMHLTRVRNGFTSRELSFSRYELLQLLGWNDGGRSYQRLEQSLQCWASVTLSYNKAWWDRTSQVWRTRTFHVLESLDLRGRSGHQLAEHASKITWNEVLFGSFQANNIKRLDLSTYFQLKLPVARQMFRFLDKRFYRAAKLELDLRCFGCEHVGLSRNYDNSQLQRRLMPGLQELEAIGYLLPLKKEARFVQVKRGEWKIVMIAQQDWGTTGKRERRGRCEGQASDQYRQLIDRGIAPKMARELASTFPERLIAAQIATHDRLVQQRDQRVAKNSAGYLVTSIRQNYQVAERQPHAKLAAARPGVTHRPKQTPREIAREKLKAEEEARLMREFNALTSAQLETFEQAALASSPRLQKESYLRLKEKGGPLFAALRRQMLVDYLKKTALPPA